MSKTKIHLIHPGEILLEEFMKPLGLSQYRVAKDICVPPIRIHEIINRKRSITPLTALRLSKYFRTSAQFWLNLQSIYDLENEKTKSMIRIRREVKPFTKVNR